MEIAAVAAAAAAAATAAGGLIWAAPALRGRREEHAHEWLFAALAYGRKDIVRKGDPEMNWNEVHPHFGTPLHAIGANGIHLEVEGGVWDPTWTLESTARIKDLKALFEFALQRGADPSVICPRSCTGCIAFSVEGLYRLKEPVGGRSALSVWLALSQRAQEIDGQQQQQQLPLASSFFDGILALLLHSIPKHRGLPRRGRPRGPAMAEVPQATAAMWQRVMLDEGPCDVVLECAGGEVRVHSAVVAGASKVLSAMLRWPRQEESSQEPWRVRLDDRREAVEAWRLMVYTGLPPEEGLGTDLLLEVLELSHRWQDHLLECGLLSAALARRVVDAASCAQILDAALTRGLPELRADCLAFARRSREVRREWEQGRFQGEAARQLASVLGPAAGAAAAADAGAGGADDGGGGGGGGEAATALGGPAAGRWDL